MPEIPANPWLRAGILHPAPSVGLCVGVLLVSSANESANGAALAFAALAALLGFGATIYMAMDADRPSRQRGGLVFLGLTALVASFLLVGVAGLHSAEVACGDRYECPF